MVPPRRRNRIRDHYGDVYIDRVRNLAFSIDSVPLVKQGNAYVLSNTGDKVREVAVMFDDGSRSDVVLNPGQSLTLDLGTPPRPPSTGSG